MDRIINGNVVDVMEDNRNAEWMLNRRETVIRFIDVDWLSRYNDDWLCEYGISPWHYSKVTGWRACSSALCDKDTYDDLVAFAKNNGYFDED